jgi:hypothetical protein
LANLALSDDLPADLPADFPADLPADFPAFPELDLLADFPAFPELDLLADFDLPALPELTLDLLRSMVHFFLLPVLDNLEEEEDNTKRLSFVFVLALSDDNVEVPRRWLWKAENRLSRFVCVCVASVSSSG